MNPSCHRWRRLKSETFLGPFNHLLSVLDHLERMQRDNEIEIGRIDDKRLTGIPRRITQGSSRKSARIGWCGRRPVMPYWWFLSGAR